MNSDIDPDYMPSEGNPLICILAALICILCGGLALLMALEV